MYRLTPILLACLVAISLLLSSFAVYRSGHDALVTVNKQKIITEFAKEMHSHIITKSTEQQLSHRFAKALKTSIDNYARKRSVVVLDSKMTLGSSTDVTDRIMGDVIVLMRGGK